MSRISNSNNDNRRINSLQILGYTIESIKMLYTKLKDYEENDLYFLWMCVFEMFPLNVLSASFINRKQSSLSSDKTMQKDCKMNTKRNREWIKKREKRNEKSGEQNERNEQASLQLWNILIHIYLFERQTKTTHTQNMRGRKRKREKEDDWKLPMWWHTFCSCKSSMQCYLLHSSVSIGFYLNIISQVFDSLILVMKIYHSNRILVVFYMECSPPILILPFSL